MRAALDCLSLARIFPEFGGSMREFFSATAVALGYCLLFVLLTSCNARDSVLNSNDKVRVDLMCESIKISHIKARSKKSILSREESTICLRNAKTLFINKYSDLSYEEMFQIRSIFVVETPSTSLGVIYSTPGIVCGNLILANKYLTSVAPGSKDSDRIMAKISRINRRNAAMKFTNGACRVNNSEFEVR